MSISFEAKISIDFSKLDTFCDFLRFVETSFQKNVKSHIFGNLKKRKIRILEHCC